MSFLDWLSNPLASDSGQPSGFRLFLFVGLVLVSLAVWGLLFRHIRRVAD